MRITTRARQHAAMELSMRNPWARRALPVWRRLAQVLAMAALLAGCGTLQRAFPSLSPPRASPPPRIAARALPPRPAEAAPAPAAAPAQAYAAPLDLANLPADRVEALLGPPASRAGIGTGERWTYRAPGCALDLFLFPAVGGGGLAVLDRRASGTGEQECLRRLRAGGA